MDKNNEFTQCAIFQNGVSCVDLQCKKYLLEVYMDLHFGKLITNKNDFV